MEAKVTSNGSSAVIAVTGQIDTNTASEAKAVFCETAEAHDSVVIDLAGVSYISSAGIRAMRSLYLIMHGKNGSLKMINATENVLSVLEMTGLLDILNLDEDR